MFGYVVFCHLSPLRIRFLKDVIPLVGTLKAIVAENTTSQASRNGNGDAPPAQEVTQQRQIPQPAPEGYNCPPQFVVSGNETNEEQGSVASENDRGQEGKRAESNDNSKSGMEV